MGITVAVLLVAANALIVGWGIYFRGYLNKKGEGLATKEDFNELKRQTGELTRTTKEIEARIDDRAWNKQRQWEMRRDALVNALLALGLARTALMELGTVSEMKTRLKAGDKLQEQLGEKADICLSTIDDFNKERILVDLICRTKVRNAFEHIGVSLQLSMSRLMREATTWQEVTKKLTDEIWSAYGAAREELGVDTEVFTSLSTE